MSYATVDDVAVQLMRDLTTAEQARVTALLPVVDRLIDQAVPSVAARIASGDLAAGVVAVVAASMIARALEVPAGVTESEERIDDYSRRYRRESASQGLGLLGDEIALLAPDEQDADVTAFSILPAGTAPYVTYPAPIGSPYL
jgi:hypothetical protein